MKLGQYVEQGNITLLATVDGKLIKHQEGKYDVVSDRIDDSKFFSIVFDRTLDWKDAPEEMVLKYVKEATGKDMIHVQIHKLNELLK